MAERDWIEETFEEYDEWALKYVARPTSPLSPAAWRRKQIEMFRAAHEKACHPLTPELAREIGTWIWERPQPVDGYTREEWLAEFVKQVLSVARRGGEAGKEART